VALPPAASRSGGALVSDAAKNIRNTMNRNSASGET